ncbi:MAG: histidinol dehydrogenase [Labilithrix sp.]|nr:histidinol dehydrogenase [Labilithrix sp.]MCW5833863.1 histidinol dehydrogenase [Labilithrix sp.]
MDVSLARLVHGTPAFDEALARLHGRGETDFAKVEPRVREILDAVQREGDRAVLRFVERFERRAPEALYVRAFDGEAALGRLAPAARGALELAAARVTEFHRRERAAMFPDRGFRFEDEGKTLGLRVRALGRVGVYAPGGKARYPSSVLMSAIPAKVAGVKDVVLATPLSGKAGEDDSILAAAHLSGVSAIVDAGGAQAVAALAFGTESVPRVDKIVGPGNAYVACAKRLVYGAVSIDSIAGPSEILVLADESADPARVAADLLSQAEHDEDAYALLVTTSAALADAVDVELARQLAALPRVEIAGESLRRHGAVFVVADRAGLVAAANAIAPEHLSLQVDDAEDLLDGIGNVGAAFIGHATPEAAGDYVAGPSHVLPTGGAVRFGSPLGVHDFVARTSLIRYTAEALRRDEADICAFARLEGLEAHARAVLVRTKPAAP